MKFNATLKTDHSQSTILSLPRVGEVWRGRYIPDPMLQYGSPYLGMGNRPSSNIDPNGMWAVGGWFRNLFSKFAMANGTPQNDNYYADGSGWARAEAEAYVLGGTQTNEDYLMMLFGSANIVSIGETSGGGGTPGEEEEDYGTRDWVLDAEGKINEIIELWFTRYQEGLLYKLDDIYNFRFQGGFLQESSNIEELIEYMNHEHSRINKEFNIYIYADNNDVAHFYLMAWHESTSNWSKHYSTEAQIIAYNNGFSIWGMLHKHGKFGNFISNSDAKYILDCMEYGNPINFICVGRDNNGFFDRNNPNYLRNQYNNNPYRDVYKLHNLIWSQLPY